jgi:hypothetical protein
MLCPLYNVVHATEHDPMIGVHIAQMPIVPQPHKHCPQTAHTGQYSVGLQMFASAPASYAQGVPQVAPDQMDQGIVSLQ